MAGGWEKWGSLWGTLHKVPVKMAAGPGWPYRGSQKTLKRESHPRSATTLLKRVGGAFSGRPWCGLKRHPLLFPSAAAACGSETCNRLLGVRLGEEGVEREALSEQVGPTVAFSTIQCAVKQDVLDGLYAVAATVLAHTGPPRRQDG